ASVVEKVISNQCGSNQFRNQLNHRGHPIPITDLLITDYFRQLAPTRSLVHGAPASFCLSRQYLRHIFKSSCSNSSMVSVACFKAPTLTLLSRSFRSSRPLLN